MWLFHAKDYIFEIFYRIGYKVGSLVGHIGGKSLTQGFKSGVLNRATAAVRNFTAEEDFREMLVYMLDDLLMDFQHDSEMNPEVDMATDDLINAVYEPDDAMQSNLDAEVDNMIADMENSH